MRGPTVSPPFLNRGQFVNSIVLSICLSAGVMVLSAVVLRRMMVFSGVASQCEHRGMGSLEGS
jgi:hypothetical protein